MHISHGALKLWKEHLSSHVDMHTHAGNTLHNRLVSVQLSDRRPGKSSTQIAMYSVLTARRYASAVYDVVVRLTVCLCVFVCLWHSGIVSKQLNVGSRK